MDEEDGHLHTQHATQHTRIFTSGLKAGNITISSRVLLGRSNPTTQQIIQSHKMRSNTKIHTHSYAYLRHPTVLQDHYTIAWAGQCITWIANLSMTSSSMVCTILGSTPLRLPLLVRGLLSAWSALLLYMDRNTCVKVFWNLFLQGTITKVKTCWQLSWLLLSRTIKRTLLMQWKSSLVLLKWLLQRGSTN